MRIGFDMLAVQSPHHANRGIGRIAREFVRAMLDRDDVNEFFLYAHADLAGNPILHSPKATLRILRPETGPDQISVSQAIEQVCRDNPDSLDVLIILSTFELWGQYLPPGPHPGGPRLAAVIYDMIPFNTPEEFYAQDCLRRFYRTLEHLRRYDVLLAISEATRSDILSLMGLPGRQVVNISSASNKQVFAPADGPISRTDRRALDLMGVTRPFVLNVGGMDPRKNPWGLIEAFSMLPEALRSTHQLVLSFSVLPEDARKLRWLAEHRGVGDALVITGEITDDDKLRLLYQRCAAFAFPSTYEGFGLPILEALQSGAPVLVGNNSSQPEVVGDAGLLADAKNPRDIAAKLERLLAEPGLAGALKAKAAEQAKKFSWAMTATRTVEALEALPARRPAAGRRFDRPHKRKPRIAFFSPFPPSKTGISDYSVTLLRELSDPYEIDLYHAAGYVPDLGVADEFRCRDYRTFARYSAELDYHSVVYQMGNSRHHTYLYDTMLRVPGVVTLHDFCLAGFHLAYGAMRGRERGHFHETLLRWYPGEADEIRSRLEVWSGGWERAMIEGECARRGWYLNEPLFDSGNKVVVHSPWCQVRATAIRPDLAGRIAVIPHGASVRSPSEAERDAIRDRFGIPRHALMVASFGFIHPDKLSPEALEAFADVAQINENAVFVFVGEEADGGAAARRAGELGLHDRVIFLGRRSLGDFKDLAAVSDVGVSLRRPPTNGETSGALLELLSTGVATVVTDVATFSDYPDHIVSKVRWDADGPDHLRHAMRELIGNRGAREAMGRTAREHVRRHNDWPRVTERYVDAIEGSHADRVAQRETIHRRSVVGARANRT